MQMRCNTVPLKVFIKAHAGVQRVVEQFNAALCCQVLPGRIFPWHRTHPLQHVSL